MEQPVNYEEFLRSKELFHPECGIDPARMKFTGLFDWQKDITRWCLRKGRAAVFADCGTGKSAIQLKIAQKLNLKTLILAPLAVAQQTAHIEAPKFKVKAVYSRVPVDELITITNYDLLHKFNPDDYQCVILDESSILKSFESATRNDLLAAFRRTPYRFCFTATPAPNDHMELGNHSEFLGNLSRTEMLSTFFVHDGGDTSKWRLKGHAKKDFWKWICSFSVMLRKPSDLGYSDDGFILPELRVHEIVIDCDDKAIMEDDITKQTTMFPGSAKTLSERRAARSQTIDERAKILVELEKSDPEAQWLVWTNLNAESQAAHKYLNKSIEVTGSDKPEEKEKALLDFAAGKVKDMVSKPSICGFGMNLQNCHKVVFLGLSDSYESYYQAVRRVWRFGQKHPVDCYIVTSSLEGEVVKNIKRKEKEAQEMAEEMVANMAEINKRDIRGNKRQGDEYKPEMTEGNGWTMHLGDNVEWIGSMQDDSIHYMVSSWPFASLYTYSASERDMGNCRTHKEFWEHMDFLIPELLRTLKPGRLMSVHCMDLPTSKERDGYIGINDFSGDVIRHCTAAGFIYHSRVVIWKDPVTAMQRTKALGLLHKQVKKDSCMSRQGIPDYLITFRKTGVNPEPVSGVFEEYIGEDGTGPGSVEDRERKSIEIWQRYASPVWADINPSDTLQKSSARENEDERHICPLQLQVIERGIELWSNPGDLVCDPFTGIGSTGYVALRTGRKFTGCDLKKSYYQQSVANLRAAEIKQESLFTPTLEIDSTIVEQVKDFQDKVEILTGAHPDGQEKTKNL